MHRYAGGIWINLYQFSKSDCFWKSFEYAKCRDISSPLFKWAVCPSTDMRTTFHPGILSFRTLRFHALCAGYAQSTLREWVWNHKKLLHQSAAGRMNLQQFSIWLCSSWYSGSMCCSDIMCCSLRLAHMCQGIAAGSSARHLTKHPEQRGHNKICINYSFQRSHHSMLAIINF